MTGSSTTTTSSTTTSGAPPTAPSDQEYTRRGGRRSNAGVIIVAIIVVIILVAVGAAYALGLGPFAKSTSGSSCSSTTSISGAGSTFIYPMMSVWSSQYFSSVRPNCLQVNYAAVGSGTGISQLTSKLVDFGASDAPLNPTQKAALPAPIFTIPDALGAVTVMYNIPGVTTGLNLTGNIVAEIYLGNITTWNDPQITQANPHTTLPSLAITPVWRTDGSGTTYVFSHFLAAASPAFNHTVGSGLLLTWPHGIGAKGSAGVAGTVASTKGAIGYAELNYAKDGGVSYAAVQNPAGNYILPNATNVGAAAASIAPSLPNGAGDWGNVTIINQAGTLTYPIATLTYIMVYQDLGKAYGTGITQTQAQWEVKFLAWIVSTSGGQSYASGLFYVPLPSSIASADLSTIGQIAYNGGSLPTS